MDNPWLELPLQDYESHMSQPAVGQAQLLSSLFGQSIDRFQPRSVALVGCAGGNGIEQLASRPIERLVALDINPAYLAVVNDRWKTALGGLETVCADLGTKMPALKPVDLAFAGLILEYVPLERALANLADLVHPSGVLVTVVQLPGTGHQKVSPSPYTSLQSLATVMNFVERSALLDTAARVGLEPIHEACHVASGGKEFLEFSFQKATSPNPPGHHAC